MITISPLITLKNSQILIILPTNNLKLIKYTRNRQVYKSYAPCIEKPTLQKQI
jgi:hypothetical protein